MDGVIGGLSHIFLTESYRYAPASVVAPFDYVALPGAFMFGYVLFGEIPKLHVHVGAAIVAASGPGGNAGSPGSACRRRRDSKLRERLSRERILLKTP